jgi:hypothetical protein
MNESNRHPDQHCDAFAANAAKPVMSITLPKHRGIEILAIALAAVSWSSRSWEAT